MGSFEASVFHYKFSNLQNITLVTVRNSLPVYDVTTSDESATGVDLDGRYRVARDAWLFGSAEYMTQKYDQYSFLDDITGQPVNLDGQPVGTPLLMLTLGGRVAWGLGSGKAEFLLQGTHQSATRCNTQLAEGFGCLNEGSVQSGIAQTKLDLRLGWTSAEHRFGVALLVNNLLNKQYLSVPSGGGESAYTLGTPYASITAPRIVSVEVKASL
jgi:iron complex outermembrane receptor protein